jgi:hypothetical protein
MLEGDIRGGVELTRAALDALPSTRVADNLVTSVARTVIEAVPESERGRSDVRDLAGEIGC